MNKRWSTVPRSFDIINVRSIASKPLIRRISAWAELDIQSKWALWVFQKIRLFRKCRLSRHHAFIFQFWLTYLNRNRMRTSYFESALLYEAIYFWNWTDAVALMWKMNILEKHEIFEISENRNVSFFASIDIDFWYRTTHMTEKHFSKIEKSFFFSKMTKTSYIT